MKYISLFSGVEAASVAWKPLGWKPIAFSEIDDFPSAVLTERFPDVPNLGDITEVDWSKYHGAVDLVVGGSPCQSFSIAGSRTGLKGQSGLMFEYIRAVQEIMPRYFVWENVPGALSSEHGAAFGQLLTEMDDLGYNLAWRVLDAQFFGVPQRRRRVFLVGCLGDRSAAEVLFEPSSLRWDYPKGAKARERIAARLKGSVNEPVCMVGTNTRASVDRGISGTLLVRGDAPIVTDTIVFDKNQITHPVNRSNPKRNEASCPLVTFGEPPIVIIRGVTQVVRKLTPKECERLQGFPDDWTNITYKNKRAPDSKRYKAMGNSMAVPVMRWIGERIDMVDKMN